MLKVKNGKFNDDYSAYVVSKSFLKKACIYGTPEYHYIQEIRNQHPGIEIVGKEIKKASGKDSYKNLTYSNMVSYICEQKNKDVLLPEFERQKRMAAIAKNPYRYIVNWFKSACFESEIDFINYRKSLSLSSSESDEQVAVA